MENQDQVSHRPDKDEVCPYLSVSKTRLLANQGSRRRDQRCREVGGEADR